MYFFQKVDGLRHYLQAYHHKNRLVGFVPTMGALHEGHLSLIRQSLKSTQCTVCSIFVNPTQFNEASDLEKYPRTPVRDLEMLYRVGCHAVFMPAPQEVYPAGLETAVDVDFGSLAAGMEGRFRPGHFQGVAQVVKRLLDIVEPGQLFLGQKDYQQYRIVQHMVDALAIPTEVVMSPIVREENGLAMSSRNERLTASQRKDAGVIYQTLKKASDWLPQYGPEKTRQMALQRLEVPGLEPEYFEIIDGHSLQAVDEYDKHSLILGCTAVWAGEVRLIDNIILKG